MIDTTTTIAEPIAISRSSVLTPLGHAVQSLYRTLRLLRELDVDEQRIVLEMLRDELEPASA